MFILFYFILFSSLQLKVLETMSCAYNKSITSGTNLDESAEYTSFKSQVCESEVDGRN